MNYGQFLNMIPEASLVFALIIVFVADFVLLHSKAKSSVLAALTIGLLGLVAVDSIAAPAAGAFGGMYVTTPAANAMKAILTAGAMIVVVMAQSWVNTTKYCGEFYLLVISTLLGMFFMMSSGSFLLFFLGLELASVPMACLVAFDKFKRKSAEAAAKYILVATFSSGVMLYGISFIYAATGSLYFDDVAARLEQSYLAEPVQLMGLAFFFSGLAFKLSLVPFHFWTADTYEGAPTPVTGYLSVCSKGAAAFALMVILAKVFGSMMVYYEYMLYVVIVLSITIANLFAIRQSDVKRFMAFSSISQAGYIMLAVIGASQEGMASLMYYVLVYVVANMAVFTVISAVEQGRHIDNVQISTFNGFYQTNPKLAFLMTLALFSLAGIPPFAGMFSKFFVFMAAAQEGSFGAYFVVFIALINTVVSLYYYLLIVKAMYIRQTDSPLPAFTTPVSTRVALAVCTVGVMLFGVCSCIYEWLYGVATF